jgi:hypothetical protein
MPQTYKILGQSFPLANTLSNVYVTDSSTSAVVNSIYIANQNIFPANVQIVLRPINETLANKHTIVRDEVVDGVSTFVLNLGITMGPNMILAANTTYSSSQVPAAAGTGRNSFGAFGLEIT